MIFSITGTLYYKIFLQSKRFNATLGHVKSSGSVGLPIYDFLLILMATHVLIRLICDIYTPIRPLPLGSITSFYHGL